MDIENMSIEKATERCKALTNPEQGCWIGISNQKAIETILNELKKKDEIIDLMAEQLAGLAIFDIEKDEPLVLGDKEEVKEYFTKKSEKEGIKE